MYSCGRAVCHEYGHKMDQFTHTKSDTSTVYASYFKAYNVLKCKDCKVEWENWEQRKRVLK